MSRILFDAFDTQASAVTASVAIDITGDFVVTATLSEQIELTAAVDITADFLMAGTLSAGSPAVALSAAVDITDDFQIAIAVRSGAVFIPPEPGNQRIAVVTHSR